MLKRPFPLIAEERAICPDCLMPFKRLVGSRRILCPDCAGHPLPARGRPAPGLPYPERPPFDQER